MTPAMTHAQDTLETRFIAPLDVLFLRGNQLFGEAGSYGEALMPPWPSVAAGALRSRILAGDGIDLGAFAAAKAAHPQLGTPTQPGSFVLQQFQVARQTGNAVELILPLPADLVVSQAVDGTPHVTAVRPTVLHAQIATSSPLPLVPVLAQNGRSKAASGWWLLQGGWQKYLQGQTPAAADLVHSKDLWAYDERIGIGLDAGTRSAADGKLFTARAVALKEGVGFAVAASGATLPASGSLRLGGDGRAAQLSSAAITWPVPDYVAIAHAGRCRLVLTSPGIFVDGWRLPGMAVDGQLTLPGLTGRVVAASIQRAETISGWDLAQRQPKQAQKAAGSASVYWLDDLRATPEALGKLVAQGLWNAPCEDAARRAEGFNRLALARRAEGFNRLALAAWGEASINQK